MPSTATFNYFYGDEATEFSYFRIPSQLITHPRFKHLSTDSKLLYGMLLDRMSLSIRAYLLTALYNAPITIGPYYSAAVRHDFAYG